MRLILGTRGSRLARTQTEWVAARLRAAHPRLDVQLEIVETTGDRDTTAPLSALGATGVFTKELELALMERRADAAVHSLKDVPTELPPGMALAAIPVRATPFDALVSAKYASLDNLPEAARVGTSSPRRRAQLLYRRPDLTVEDIRGNVETRIRRVEAGDFDATILAVAGLERLGLGEHIKQPLSDDLLPAPGQGALAIEVRGDDDRTLSLCAALHDPGAAAEVTAERACLKALGGGCHAPMGSLGRVSGERLSLAACVCGVDGMCMLRVDLEGGLGEADALGEEAARRLFDQGAAKLLGDAQ